MKKVTKYLRYLVEYLKFGDIKSIVASARYLYNSTSHSNDRVIRTSVGTFFCRKNTNDFQFANYYYEWGVKKFILSCIKDFTVFIEAGSCTGDYTILVSKFGLKCIAFEPVPYNYETLVKNLQLNNLADKVKTYPVGLGNENKDAYFRFNPVNTGASHIDTDNITDCKVQIRTFDSLLSDLKLGKEEKILFKLDVEGMEPEVLQGAVEFIKQYPHLTFILEDKHTGQHAIRTILRNSAEFAVGTVDEFNIYARKISNIN